MYKETNVLIDEDIDIETAPSPFYNIQKSSTKVDPNVYAEAKIPAPNPKLYSGSEQKTKDYKVLKEIKNEKKKKDDIKSLFKSDFSTEIETVTYTEKQYSNPKTKFQLSRGGKIGLICYSIITFILGFAITYNIFTLNSINNKISTISTTIETVQRIQIDTLIRQINNISNEENLNEDAESEGYVPIDENNTYNLTLNPKQIVTKEEVKTNFFDKICNFILKFFGG